MIKYIFLDIDGVLMSYDNMYSYGAYVRTKYGNEELKNGNILPAFQSDEFGKLFDDRCVRWFNSIINILDNPDIIICSSWRCLLTINELRACFDKRGVKCNVVDYTPRFSYSKFNRGNEVEVCFNETITLDNSIIIDDDSGDYYEYQKDILLQPNSQLGLTYKEFEYVQSKYTHI